MIRCWLKSRTNRQELFGHAGFEWLAETDVEVIGERALPEGYADILIQDDATSSSAVFEVKLSKTEGEHFIQVSNYLKNMNSKSTLGFIISKGVAGEIPTKSNIVQIICNFERPFTVPMTFSELVNSLRLKLCS